MAEQRKGLFFPGSVTDLGFTLNASKKSKKSQDKQGGMTEEELEAARERARAIVSPKKKEPTDYRPKYYPGSNIKWQGTSRLDPLGNKFAPSQLKSVQRARDTGRAAPYTSARGYDILKKYYGKDTDRKLREATEARDKSGPDTLGFKRAVMGDATRLSKDTLPVYRDKELAKYEASPGVFRSAAGYYSPSRRDVRMKPTISRRDDEDTLEHEIAGHHVNRLNPYYAGKHITPYLPKQGVIPSGGGYAEQRVHAFFSPQELGEAMSKLVRQDFAATGKDMTDERFDEIMSGKNIRHFKGWQFDRNNAGHFIHNLRRWSQTKEGQELIKQLRKIHKQFVDTGERKYFPDYQMA